MSPVELIQLSILGASVFAAIFVTALALKTWRGDKYLCDDCQFNTDADCQKAERPRALDCGAYMKRDSA